MNETQEQVSIRLDVSTGQVTAVTPAGSVAFSEKGGKVEIKPPPGASVSVLMSGQTAIVAPLS